MNLSIYIVVAFYISKGNLAQVVSGVNPKPFGLGFKSSQQQINVRHCSSDCSITVAR